MYSVYMYLYLYATHNTITYKILQFKDTKKCTGRNGEESKETIKLTVKF